MRATFFTIPDFERVTMECELVTVGEGRALDIMDEGNGGTECGGTR